jgi:hypothetical protein
MARMDSRRILPGVGGFIRVLRIVLFEDWLLKFICLGLAILMWFYIDGELTDQNDFVVGIRKRDIALPQGWAIAPDRPLPKFTVRVRGPRRRLQLLSTDAISFRKQVVNNPQPGFNVLEIQPADVEAEGFDVLAVSPKDETQAVVELVATTSRSKPIWVATTGKPKAGYLMDKPTVDPPQVNVEAPSQDLELIENIPTEEVDVTDVDKDIVRDVKLRQVMDVSGHNVAIRTTPETVRVTIPVRQEQATRRITLEVLPVPPQGLAMSVEPKSVEVEIQADAAELAAPDLTSKIMLFVKWPVTWDRPKDADATLGPTQVPVQVSAPPRVQVLGPGGKPLPVVNVKGALAPSLNGKQ